MNKVKIKFYGYATLVKIAKLYKDMKEEKDNNK